MQTIQSYIKNKNGKTIKNREMPYVMSLCKNLTDLKDLCEYNGGYKRLQRIFGWNKTQARFIITRIDKEYSIDELKVDVEDILSAHKQEWEEYEEEIRKKNEALKAQRAIEEANNKIRNYSNYRRYDYSGKYEALHKNEDLVYKYEDFKNSMCNGIGQRRIKLFLNKKIKNGDKIAKLYRIALELENTNINAKKYKNTLSVRYKDNLYEEKESLLKELVGECIKYNETEDDKISFGYEHTNNYSANLLLYFELPFMEQISFHCNISLKELNGVPKYEYQWDGKVNATLRKIENAIIQRYGEELISIKEEK